MDYNPSNESLGKNFTKIVIVIRNIGFTTSPESTTITPEKFGKPLKKCLMSSQLTVHESPMVR